MWTSALTLVLAAFHLQPAVLQAPNHPVLGQEFWDKNGRDDLSEALKVKLNTGVAKNVILFIGDGMSAITVAAARIYRAGESSNLVWEKFDHVGLLKTYSANKQVPDSASTATSLLSGVKANFYTMGLDHTVNLTDCQASLNPSVRLANAAVWAQQAGKATGPNEGNIIFESSAKEVDYSFDLTPDTSDIESIGTYCNDKMVPDSSVTASAMMTGVKGNKGTLGTDGSVKAEDCKASLNKDAWTISNAFHAQQAGKSTGVVTNTRITHATPGSVYAHSSHRDWECNAYLPENAKDCKDIARQLIEDEPGRSLNVIMGGGRQVLVSGQVGYADDPLETGYCRRNDSRNLINEWIERQQNMSAKYAYVNNTGGLKNLDIENVDNLLGIFTNSHFPFNYLRDKSDAGPPSVEQMATTAVKILSKNPKGFFLMVEGGEIDLGHHRGRAKVALDETVQLHLAVKATVNLLEELKIKDETLVIVTSDHGHSLTINGYPDRGSSILGIADKSRTDQQNYTTLMYAVSGKENFQYEVVDGQVKRRDPSKDDTTSWDYHQQATVLNDENKHEGGDVNVYAIGPMSHLFHNVHEQSYVAHVIQYAAQIGRYQNRNVISSSPVHLVSCALILLTFLGIRFL